VRRLLGLVPESTTSVERLIDKKCQSYDLQVELDAKKQHHAVKMAQIRAKEGEPARRNLENQEEVVSKDRYIRYNSKKRQHQEERLVSEDRLLHNKEEELAHLLEEHARLTEQKADMEAQLTGALPCKAYLDSVFEAAPEIVSSGSANEVQGIVLKHRTLTEWRGALQVRLMRSKEELQKLRSAMALYETSSTNCSVEIDYQIKCVAQAEAESFRAFGRQHHEQETQARQNPGKGGGGRRYSIGKRKSVQKGGERNDE
jgi:hypothetical protein